MSLGEFFSSQRPSKCSVTGCQGSTYKRPSLCGREGERTLSNSDHLLVSTNLYIKQPLPLDPTRPEYLPTPEVVESSFKDQDDGYRLSPDTFVLVSAAVKPILQGIYEGLVA
ncbi:hypothetical protein J6590_098196 [Homalodisca vitripennis]|nr:hypothetical protein J6590_098196 [Homalodisca vitripennis]